MNVETAYNAWAQQYDTNINATRDLEHKALQQTLADIKFENVLEIGCGTGKNTNWLITKANHVTGVDLSAEMLAKAKEKITNDKATFIQADIKQAWAFARSTYNLITFSLMLEHIEELHQIFKESANSIDKGGYIYVGELHPFKQYSGSKARFETEEGLQVVECYNHHVSDFIIAAKDNGFSLIDLNEFFDNNDKTLTPRVLTLLFKK